MPGGVVALVVIAPDPGFRLMPTGSVGLVTSILTTEFSNVAGKPLTVSLARMSAIGVEAVPATAVPDSVTGTITAVTVIVSTTLAHTAVGAVKSHSL
jgi:hypothetical protein